MTGCLFRFLCTLISMVGFLLVIYVILAICTDVYFDDGIWRDKPFKYNNWTEEKGYYCDQCKHENDLWKEAKSVCDGRECTYQLPLFFYSKGGSGFLGAMFTDIDITGFKYNGDSVPASFNLSDVRLAGGSTHLYEERTNKILFEMDFTCPDDIREEDCTEIRFGLDDIKFKSISGNFWDFMPMGPGNAFGIAKDNLFFSCSGGEDIDERLKDHECYNEPTN